MQTRIEVKSTALQNISGVSSRTGKAYSMNKQNAWVHLGEDFPEKIELNVEEGKPYAVGMYTLADSSFFVDKNRNLSVRPVLVAIAPADLKKAG